MSVALQFNLAKTLAQRCEDSIALYRDVKEDVVALVLSTNYACSSACIARASV